MTEYGDYDVVICRNRTTGEVRVYRAMDDVPDDIMDDDAGWAVVTMEFGEAV